MMTHIFASEGCLRAETEPTFLLDTRVPGGRKRILPASENSSTWLSPMRSRLSPSAPANAR
jgi:hypothetical protein